MNIDALDENELDLWVDISLFWSKPPEFSIYNRVAGFQPSRPKPNLKFLRWFEWEPHKDWRLAGPIIEEYGIATHRSFESQVWKWTASAALLNVPGSGRATRQGETLLVAAMRTFVASRFPTGLSSADAQTALQEYENA
ncbi:DUF2591 family protein [Oxalobacteraceae sp. CFBP 8755]|nr:DUF2591 family protein [Oxalobacteraceae sp. CFBP 8755]